MTEEIARSGFRIGPVLSRSLSVLGRNIVSFALIALVITGIGAWITFEIATRFQILGRILTTSQGIAAFAIMAAWLLSLCLVTAAVVYGTDQKMRGQHCSLGDYLRHGFATILPIIGITVIWSIMVLVGLALFFIPGLFVVTVFLVTVPAAVAERRGITARFGRSLALTKGNRWWAFAIVAILGTAISVIQNLVGFLVVSGLNGVSATTIVTAVVVQQVLMMMMGILYAVVAAVCYHELRVAKEGAGTERVAAVFD